MLKRVKRSRLHTNGGVFAIVASRYNQRYVDGMLVAAQRCLRDARAADIIVVRVPGAYEVPLAVARLARTGTPSLRAIICLGVIFRGATAHAQNIGEVITSALMQIQLEREIPVVHEVLLLENRQQAEERCLGRTSNRGLEAAQTAIAMARVMQKLQPRGRL
jgi:6,7-dimethyl-8-ribityllumazine synthase